MKRIKKKSLYYIMGMGALLVIAALVTNFPKESKQSTPKVDQEGLQNPSDYAPKPKRIVSPIGIARFIRIESLDNKYKKEGEYTLMLELENNKESKDYLEEISSELASFKTSEEKRLGRELRSAKLPWRIVGIENLNGQKNRQDDTTTLNDEIYLVKYREQGSFIYKGKKVYTSVYKFDDKGTPLTPKISPNSRVKVSADVILYNNVYGVGASLRLKAVQLIEQGEEPKETIPEDFGFIEENWGAGDQKKPEIKETEEDKKPEETKSNSETDPSPPPPNNTPKTN
jgi:hypothetical protein